MGGSPKAVNRSELGHPLPRRTPSVLSSSSKDAPSQHARAVSADGDPGSPGRVRRNSTDESNETGRSDTRVWFNKANQNPSFDINTMEVDSPYFQKNSDSPNHDPAFLTAPPPHAVFPSPADRPLLRPTVTHSSSADEYRSVIDDLTIENKRLKEELKRYKQFGTDLMRKDKLFEIKVHGLPGKKKRELEATLREFASTLGSSDTSRGVKKPSKSGNRFKSSGGTTSKHASSSSSNSRPVDSAYASMSTGPSTAHHSSGKSQVGRRSLISNARSTAQKVESYLEDIPEGLYPRYLSMTEKDKQKLVVRRLEQLFTGEMSGPTIGTSERTTGRQELVTEGCLPKLSEAAREAQIQIREKKQSSRDNRSSNSNGNSNGDGGSGSGTGSGGGDGSGIGSRESPQGQPASEQRPTRPLDLDPDRVQVPSENMEYMRHLGMIVPALQAGEKASPRNVSMDADGWVYLNLLCNLAQLHIINVTPAFIRAAVSAKSTKFQLSPDGQKIRWRGGTDGTRFSSDSGNNSSRDRSTDGDDSSDKSGSPGKKRKFEGDGAAQPGVSKLIRENTRSSAGVHYKPMFIQQPSFDTSGEEGSSSLASGLEDSNENGGASKWDYSGSGSSPRKRRRVDGAIVYYTGAPFCTDLSGDPGDISPVTHMASTNMAVDSRESSPKIVRTLSGSSLPYRPLSNNSGTAKAKQAAAQAAQDLKDDDSDGSMADASSEAEDYFQWQESDSEDEEKPPLPCLKACGLGGVQPDDHFVMIVTTRRQRDSKEEEDNERPRPFRVRSNSTTASILERIKAMKTASPRPVRKPERAEEGLNLTEYMSARIRRLEPTPLPPAASFVPPFSSSSSETQDDDSELLDSEEGQEAGPSGLQPFYPPPSARLALFRADSNSAYPEGLDLSPSDEEGEVDSDEPLGTEMELRRGRGKAARSDAHNCLVCRPQNPPSIGKLRTQSSVATAGGAASGYNSSAEE